MDTPYLLILGLLFSLATLSYLVINKRHRDVLTSRFNFRGRRSSSANTPPRSFSPEKQKGTENVPAADYKNVFPPSRREALRDLYDSLPLSLKTKSAEQLVKLPIESGRNCVPLSTPFDKLDGELLTPCGFSVYEIRQLGDFPDYATLSGVPAPQPYKDFDINKALPRPYRPFRWAYHQTMCKSGP